MCDVGICSQLVITEAGFGDLNSQDSLQLFRYTLMFSDSLTSILPNGLKCSLLKHMVSVHLNYTGLAKILNEVELMFSN